MSPDMLNTCPDETLIRASGTYPGGGTFTDCWARPVPQYMSGAIDGADRLWEVLVFGSGGIAALTTTACITSAEVLYSETDRSTISDGYHTFAELYEYRMLYSAHAAEGWLAAGIPVVKSWHHSDGEACFGGGWFVVVVDLYPHGQVSNHYPAADWDLFHVPEVDQAPEWDGHTPADAAARLRAALTTTEATR